MSSVWIWISSFFSKSSLGVIFKIIFTKASSAMIQDILNNNHQRIAYEFVKELHANNTMTVNEKAWAFNQMMIKWAKREGIILSQSVINCLRELAVSALKAEEGDA